MTLSKGVLDLLASEGGTIVSSRTTPNGVTFYEVKGSKGAEIISQADDQLGNTAKPEIKAASTKPSI